MFINIKYDKNCLSSISLKDIGIFFYYYKSAYLYSKTKHNITFLSIISLLYNYYSILTVKINNIK
jgi:hypothetical protein